MKTDERRTLQHAFKLSAVDVTPAGDDHMLVARFFVLVPVTMADRHVSVVIGNLLRKHLLLLLVVVRAGHTQAG